MHDRPVGWACQEQHGPLDLARRALPSQPTMSRRLRSLVLPNTAFGKALYRCRSRIEHCFAQLTAFVGGLGPPPFWVRRFHRVRLWVQSKLLLNAIHSMKFNPPTTIASE